jgi:hypothetical protein
MVAFSEAHRLMDGSDRRLAILLVVAGIIVQLPGLLWGAPGGKAVNNALRILGGDVPYRDFWTMYAPGHFYLVAILFKLFGTHIWVQGVASQTLVAVDAAILFVLTRRLGLARRPACLVGAAFVGVQWGTNPEVSSYETVLPFLLLALDRVVCYAQGRGARELVVAGVLCGVGAWFKHDVSFYVAIGIAGGLSASWYLIPDRRPDGWVSPAGVLIRIGGGALFAALPVVALLAWKAAPDAWRDLIVFPATDFRVVRGEVYPALIPEWRRIQAWVRDPWNVQRASQLAEFLAEWIQANIPQIVFVIGIVVLARKRRELDEGVIAVSAISLAVMPLFWASAHVQQNTHFVSLWILSVFLGALVWAGGGRPWVRPVLASLFILHTGALLVRPALTVARTAYFWRNHAKLDFPNAAGVRLPRREYEVYQPIVSFIRDHVPDSEAIYVGIVRHDAIMISNQAFYYLAGRPVASRFNELHPGFADREEIQREIIADLNRLNVRCAVLWDFGWPKPMMDDILAGRRHRIPALGATVLDEFLRREFQEVARHGEYVLVWRRGAAMPQRPTS